MPCLSHLLIALALGVWLELFNGLQRCAVPLVTQLPQMRPLSSSLFACFNFVLFLLEPEKGGKREELTVTDISDIAS